MVTKIQMHFLTHFRFPDNIPVPIAETETRNYMDIKIPMLQKDTIYFSKETTCLNMTKVVVF